MVRRNRVRHFYDADGGEQLVDETKHPSEIKEYLAAEKTRILQAVSGYSGLLEVGCMDGRNVDVAAKLDKKYIGIDLVKRFIEQAQARIRSIGVKGIARVCDVTQFDRTVLSTDFMQSDSPSDLLAVFPFNSFGNIDLPEKAIDALQRVGLDILILTYGTDDKTTRIRVNYVRSSGLKDVRVEKDDLGVAIHSGEGFCSYAYFQETLANWAGKRGYCLERPVTFSKIGKAYALKLEHNI